MLCLWLLLTLVTLFFLCLPLPLHLFSSSRHVVKFRSFVEHVLRLQSYYCSGVLSVSTASSAEDKSFMQHNSSSPSPSYVLMDRSSPPRARLLNDCVENAREREKRVACLAELILAMRRAFPLSRVRDVANLPSPNETLWL